MYFFSSWSDLTVAWYMTFFCRHCPLSGHLSFLLFWQLQVFPSAFSSRVFSSLVLWACIVLLMFFVQLYESFTVFRFSIGFSGFPLGKCFSSSFRKQAPRLVVTAWL